MPLITDSRHPTYGIEDYTKYRLTYRGGREFVKEYLKKYSQREDQTDFDRRLELTYNPAFATEALDEVRDGISLRMPEIIRTGGTQSYNTCISGLSGGVDLAGSSMDFFIGQKVIPELLTMGKVGIYVDMPNYSPFSTLAQFERLPRPYIYYYQVEDILNWQILCIDNELVLTAVLLRERHWQMDGSTGLPQTEKEYFRLVNKTPNGVKVRIYDQYVDPQTNNKDEAILAEYDLNLRHIPFVMPSINKSLLNDIADYQIALLNLASADLSYAIQSNFPFYVEGYDPKTQHLHTRSGPVTSFDADGNATEGEAKGKSNDSREIVVGTTRGRQYPMGANVPAFIHPSSEPLKISMEKQTQMKEDIRRLLNLAVANVAPTRQSADAKKIDQHGLEAGLSRIGTILEGTERRIAELWAEYEGEKPDNLVIAYPATYSLKTDEERFNESKSLKELKGAAPSKTYAKEVSKLITKALLDGRVTQKTLAKINTEIDKAKYGTSDIEELVSLYEAGVIDGETTAEAANFDPSVVKKAQEERTKRLADIAAAQAEGSGAALNAARGVKEGGGDADDEKTISQNPDGE